MHRTLYRWLASLMILSMFLSSAAPAHAQVSVRSPSASTATVLSEDFESGQMPSGWTVTGDPGWIFDNAGGRQNQTGSTGNFAIADSDNAGNLIMNTALLTPVLNLSSYTTATLTFKTNFRFYGSEVAEVDISTDGGSTWAAPTWTKSGADFTGAASINLPIASSVKIRFNYTNADWAWYWQVDQVRVEVTSSAALPPSAPTSLAIVSIAANQVALKWKDNSTDETGFKLEWSDNGSTSWTQVGIFAANAVTGEDGTILCGTTRYYRVSSVNGNGTSSPSNTISATTTACPPAGPTAPSGLGAVLSGSNINLSWTDNSNNETGFKVQWSANGASGWTELSRPTAGTTSATDSAVPCGTTRYYRVLAYNATGDSTPSNTASASASSCPVIPTAPSGLTATLSGANIVLTWTDNSTTETGFKVEHSTDAGTTWAEIGTVGANITTYTDNNVVCNTRHVYRVRAASAAGNSAYSPAAERMSAACTVSSKPTSLNESFTGTSLPSGWSILPASGALTWAFNDPGARTNKTGGSGGFAIIDSDKAGRYDIDAQLRTPALDLSANTSVKLIYRQYFYALSNSTADVDYSLDGGTNWTNVSRKTGATTSGEVTVLVSGAAGQSNVIFRFRYYNAYDAWYWQVDDVRVTSAIEAAAPLAPSAATASLSGADATVSWTDNSSNETNFVVERSINSGSTWAEAGRTAANIVTFVDKNLPCATAVTYRVKALAGTSSSAYASTTAVTTAVCAVRLTSLNETFNTSSASTLPAGWLTEGGSQVTISGGTNKTGGTGYAPAIYTAASLRSPAIDLSSLTAVRLSLKAAFWCSTTCTGRQGTADISKDGGTTWVNVWGTSSAFTGPIVLDISTLAAGQANIVLRFTSGGNYIQVDDVKIDALPTPSAPTNLSVSKVPDGVLVAWKGDGMSKYRVQRSPNGSDWTQIGEVTDGSTQYLDRTAAANTSYQYRVLAFNAAGASSASSAASLTIGDAGVRYVDVTVSLYQGAPISTAALRAKYEAVINAFADGVFEMSNGAIRLGKVTIYRDKANFDRANIQWIQTCWPNASVSGFLTPGARIEMCDVFSGYNLLDHPVDGGNVIAHEFGHNFFGVFDEYVGQDASSTDPGDPLKTDVPTQYSVMNDSWSASTDLRWLNFSTAVNFSAKTAQGRVFGASSWDTITRPPSQDPYIPGYPTRLYWTELGAVKPAAGQMPVIDLTSDPDHTKARGHLQIIWSPAFPSANPSSSPQNMLSVANGIVREIVIDTSSAMTDRGALEETKTALAALINQVPDGDVLGLITYHSTAAISSSLTPITSQADRDALINIINNITGGGSDSNPGAGLQAAFDALTAVSVPSEAVRVVYWISAGQTTTGENPASLVDEFTTNGIPLWIYAFNPTDGDQTNLQMLADMTAGSYTTVKDSASLQKAFEQADQDTSPAQDTMLKWSGWVMDRGTSAAEDVVVDSTLGQVDFEISYDGPAADLTLTVTDPDTNQYDITLATDCETSDAGTVDEFTTCTLSIPSPISGVWTISSSEVDKDTYFMYYVTGVAQTGQSTYAVSLTFPDGNVTTYPQPIRVEAKIQQGFPVAGLNVVGYVFDPEGYGSEILFRDDGIAPDGIANDGIYSAYAGYASDGDYWVAVQFDNYYGEAYYTDAGLMTTGKQTLPAISENFERYAEEQVTVKGWQEDDHPDSPDDPETPPTTLALDNTPIYGMIDFENDADVFKITAPDSLAGPYALRINRLGLGMDPYVIIYAEDGSWEYERYFDFTPDSGDELFVPLDLKSGQSVIVMVFHYDETAVGGVYAVSAGTYQSRDPVSAFAPPRKTGSHDLFLPAVKK